MEPLWRVIERHLDDLRHWAHDEEMTKRVLDWLGCGLREWFIDQKLSADDAETLSEKTVCQICLKFQDEDSDRRELWPPGNFQNWCIAIAARQYSIGITQPVAPSLTVCRALRIAIHLLTSRDRWLISWHLGQTDDDTAAASLGVSTDKLQGTWGRDALKHAVSRFRDMFEGDSDLLDWFEPPKDDLPDDDRADHHPPNDSNLVSTKPQKE